MTNERAKSELMQLYGSLSEEKKQALDVLMAQAEKTCDLEKSNFDVRQYKLDTDTAYECGYNAGLQAQADGEYISRQAVLETLDDMDNVLDEDRTIENYKELLKECYEVLPSVKPQEKTGHWKEPRNPYDIDGTYYCYCDNCGGDAHEMTDFCPNCGCRMVEEQESEEI